jgi:hypothetical protein
LTKLPFVALVSALLLTPGIAAAQTFSSESTLLAGTGGGRRYKSPQLFAIEIRFGPYRPNVDSEFDGRRTPFRDYFGTSQKVMSQLEFDYELFHRFGTVAVGLGFGYYTISAKAPIGTGSGVLTNDSSSMMVLPFSASAIYRFDYFLETRGFPLVPYGKAGLDYAYWQITDGNDEIANDGLGGTGRGGTPGWHVAAGLALVLDMFDSGASRDFDNDLGVNHTSLVFQYTHSEISGLGNGDKLHVGDTNWSLGIMFQF